MPDSLTSLEAAIRKAVTADAFAEAEALAGQYVAEAERLLQAMPAGAAGADAAAALQKRTGILFDFAIAMATASRSYAGAQLDHLRLIARYRETCAEPPTRPVSQSTA